MNNSAPRRFSLTGNQLKILAMITMTCDHVGLQLLPQYTFLRILGRLALPIYAYMIAEGCRHTRDLKKYLLRIMLLAVLCQLVYFFAMGSLYMCILVTFSLSICLIWTWDRFWNTPANWIPILVTAAVFFICVALPDFLPGFQVDYGLPGVLLPVLIYFGKSRLSSLITGLLLLALTYGGNQWWAFAAIPFLMLYNGTKGTHNIGRLFYWYYPAHLVIIFLLILIFT